MSRFLMILMFLSIFCSGLSGQKAGDDIRHVDFKNFTYKPFCLGGEVRDVTVADGAYFEEKEVDGYSVRFFFTARVEGYGDVNGDGRDDALINSTCNTGGTGNFSEGFVYTIRQGKPFLLARIEGGDRAYGGIREISVDKRVVTVDRNDPGQTGEACCAENIARTSYKWNGTGLVEFGQTVKRELYPAKRIDFEQERSFGTAAVRIAAGAFQRFVAGATEGQVLIVYVQPATATVNLRYGKAETTGADGYLRAVLLEKGDLTFEVWNPGAVEEEFTVMVEIR